MVVSNRNLLFQRSIFRGYISFREGKCYYLFGSFLQNEKWRPANLRKTWTFFGSTNVTTDSWLVFQHANDGPFPIKWPDLLGSPNKSSSSDPHHQTPLYICWHLNHWELPWELAAGLLQQAISEVSREYPAHATVSHPWNDVFLQNPNDLQKPSKSIWCTSRIWKGSEFWDNVWWTPVYPGTN